jgi:hypothetical protein
VTKFRYPGSSQRVSSSSIPPHIHPIDIAPRSLSQNLLTVISLVGNCSQNFSKLRFRGFFHRRRNSFWSGFFYEDQMLKKRELIPFAPCIRRSASGNNLLDGVGFGVDQLHRNLVMEWSVRFSAAQTTQSSRWMEFFSAQEHLHPGLARQRM